MIVDGWQGHRDVLDSLLEGFQIISRDWRYLYVNPAAARHGRRAPEELFGRRMSEVYPGIDETPLFATLERAMLERRPATFDTLFTFPDGSTRWFEVRVSPVAEGICVQSVDIQARKEAEALVREQESVAALGQMAAVVAHEIKNPLAGLSGALQVLKRRRQATDPEITIIDEMLSSITGLDRLIRDLLVFAKPIQIEARPLTTGDVVRSALRSLAEDQALSRHAVTVCIDDQTPVVRGDLELLKSVFRNLLLNAAQAMHEPGSIEVRASFTGAHCRITVTDTGPGIAPSLAARIFEPFVTGRKGGIGLGLSISRRIARLHGGDLALQPASRGAAFVLTLPVDSE